MISSTMFVTQPKSRQILKTQRSVHLLVKHSPFGSSFVVCLAFLLLQEQPLLLFGSQGRGRPSYPGGDFTNMWLPGHQGLVWICDSVISQGGHRDIWPQLVLVFSLPIFTGTDNLGELSVLSPLTPGMVLALSGACAGLEGWWLPQAMLAG